MKKTIFLSSDIEVLIVSFGGVGTTFLMKEIEKYKKINCPDNTDGYKHLPIPPISFKRDLKVIYVFGNPILATVSLFRRSYHHALSLHSQKFYQSNFLVPQDMTLQEYARNKKEGLFIKRHFENWHEKFRLYPTLFLKYESLFESLEILVDFLKLPNSFIENFPKKKERHSDLSNISEDVKLRLEKSYGKFRDRLEQMPSTEIRDKKNIFILSKKVYQQAIWQAFLKKNSFIRKVWNFLTNNNRQ